MDRPRTSGNGWRAGVVVAGCLLSGAGCLSQPTLPSSVGAFPTVTTKNDDKPKRDPKPSTCVAFADFCVSTANEPNRSPQERDQRREQAREAYLQALKTDPNNVPAYAGLANLYELMADHERAVAMYQKAVQIAPKEAVLWFELGMSQARHKEWAAARENLQKAQQLDPDNRRYADMLGFCLARTGDFAGSIACFRHVMSEAQAHYNLARMLHHVQQDGVARRHLEIALRLQPDLEGAAALLAELNKPVASSQAAATPTVAPTTPVLPPAAGAAGWN